jgi:drug/metabolite transporter (DMT)-like permease
MAGSDESMTATTSPSSGSNTQTRGYGIALIGTAVWSTTAILIRYLTETDMPPLVLALWRDVMAATAMFIALRILRPHLLRLPRRHLTFFLLYGLVLMVFNATWTISVALNGAAVSTVLVYSSPALTALLGRLLWRESLGVFKIAAVLLSLVGSAFVSGAHSAELWALNPAGILVGLASGLMFAVYSLFGKESSRRGVNPWSALTYSFAFAAVYFTFLLQLPIHAWAPELSGVGGWGDLFWLGSSLSGWGILLLLAWGPTLGGYGLYMVSLSMLPASVANLIASLEPSITAALAYLFLGERLTTAQIAGSALVIAGVLLLRLRGLNPRRRSSLERDAAG